MLFQDFPQELIAKVISNLNGKDILSFLQCHSSFYNRSLHDSFWFDLCRLNGVHYCFPGISWKDLFCSGQISGMCPHLNTNLFNTRFVREKKRLLWSSFSQKTGMKDHIVCMHPSCDFSGKFINTCAQYIYTKHTAGETEYCTDHFAATKHSLSIKITPLHTLEIWCNSCVKTVSQK